MTKLTSSTPAPRSPLAEPDAERALLGSLLVDPERAQDLIEKKGLTPDHFTETRHRQLFTALSELLQRGGGLDIVTFADALKARTPEDPITIAYLTQLIDATPTSAHAAYYADILLDRYQRRRLRDALGALEERLHDLTLTPDLIQSTAEQKLFALGSAPQNAPIESWGQTVTTVTAEMKDLILTPGRLAGLPTGYPELDKRLTGLKTASLNIIAARPGIGKTTLALNIAENLARGLNIKGEPIDKGSNAPTPRNVLLFSLEMPREQLVQRMLLAHAEIPSNLIGNGKGLPIFKRDKALASLARAQKAISALPLFIDDQGGLDIATLRARARRHHRQHPLATIIIDYLGLIRSPTSNRYANVSQIIGDITGEIKAMAKELKIPVILLCQLNRNIEQRADPEPKLSDLRDSGSIEQDADTVLVLHRAMGEQATTLTIANTRHGLTGTLPLLFEGASTRFKEAPAEQAHGEC